MNIAILCHTGAGGSGVVATELAIVLAQLGHNIHILGDGRPFRLTDERLNGLPPAYPVLTELGDTPPVKSFWGQLVREATVSVSSWLSRLGLARKSTGSLHFHEMLSFDYPLFSDPLMTLRAANSLAELIKKHDIQIVHAHYAVPHSTSAILARDSGHPVKVVTTVHGTDVMIVGADPAFNHTTRHALRCSDAVTAVSHSLAQAVHDRFELERPVKMIPNWIDGQRFVRINDPEVRRRFAQPEEKIIVHASNFRPVKRSQDVIKIFELIQRELPARLLMIGEGPDRRSCEELCQELDLTGRVQFINFTPKIERILGVADMLLLPSEYESFGLIALEAMAAEMVVVASSVGGLPEVVRNGKTGVLCPVGDIEKMAEESVVVLRCDGLCRTMGTNARSYALEHFAPEKVLQAYLSLYEGLLMPVETSREVTVIREAAGGSIGGAGLVVGAPAQNSSALRQE